MLSAALLALFACGVSMLTLLTGFGLGTLLLPAFALFLPLDVAVACTAVVHAANNAFKVWLLLPRVRWDVVWRFGVLAVLAAFAGAAVLTTLTEREPLLRWSAWGREFEVVPLNLGLGLLIVVFALFDLVPRARALRPAPRWLPLGGLLSGFFGGLSGHQGALRASFLAPLGLAPEAYAATQALLAMLVDAARLSIYGGAFLLAAEGRESVPWGLVASTTAAAFAGALLGRRLLPRVTIDALRGLIGALLVGVGLALASGVAA